MMNVQPLDVTSVEPPMLIEIKNRYYTQRIEAGRIAFEVTPDDWPGAPFTTPPISYLGRVVISDIRSLRQLIDGQWKDVCGGLELKKPEGK